MDDVRGRPVTHLSYPLHVNNRITHTPPLSIPWIPRSQRTYPAVTSASTHSLGFGQRINTIIRHAAIDLFAPSIACSRFLVSLKHNLIPTAYPTLSSCPTSISYASIFGSML